MKILVIADMHGYIDEVSEFFRKIHTTHLYFVYLEIMIHMR